jgi:hypothetical protein
MPIHTEETIPTSAVGADRTPGPPASATLIALDEPLTLFLWDDPGGNYTGHTLLALAPTAEAARELLVEDAAAIDVTAIHHYRAYREGRRSRPLGAYRNLWEQLQADPRALTRPVALRLRPLAQPDTAHS